MVDLTDRELMYFVGLFEGEGYFAARPTVAIQMVDKDIMNYVAQKLNKPLYTYSRAADNAQDIHNVSLHGRDAIDFMKLLYPYMGQRRKAKIEEAIANYKPTRKQLRDDEIIECFARLMIGCSQKELAEHYGVSQATISSIANVNTPKIQRVAKSIGWVY